MHWLDRNKWFVLAALFLIVNAWGLYRLMPTAPNGETKTFVSFEPGDGAILSSNAPLSWVFSRPMVEPDRIGQESITGSVSITPAVPGLFRWTTPQRLEFHPRVDWPGCTPFAAALQPDMLSLDEIPIAPPFAFSFKTPSLQLIGAAQVNFTSDRRVTLQLTFSDPVSTATLEKFIDLESPREHPLRWEALGHTDSRIALLRTEPVGADHIVLKARRGLHSPAGPLTLENDRELRIACYDRIAIRKIEGESESFGGSSIVLQTSKPLDLDSAASFIDITPPVHFVIESRSDYWNGERYALLGDFLPGQTYSVTFRQGLKGTDESLLAADQAFNVFVPDRPAGIAFTTSGHYLSPRGNLLVNLSSVNLGRFHIRARRIYANNLVQFIMRREGYYNWFYGQADNGISSMVGEREFIVDRKANQVQETRIDVGSILTNGIESSAADGTDVGHSNPRPHSPSGAFILSASSDSVSGDDHLIVVTDIGLSVKRSDRDLLVWANSLYTLAPIVGADIRIFNQANQLLAQGRTDAQGLAHFEGDFTGEREPFLVTAERDEELSYLQLQGTDVILPDDSGGRPYPARYEAYVFTDRGIYRPGETARVSAIVRDADGVCPPAFPVELRVIKPDGKTRSVLPAVLSDFGVVAFDISWADHDRTGRYELQLLTPGSTQAVGSAEIALEEFVPPQIAVEIDTPHDIRATPAKGIAFTVSARHLFGSPAAGNSIQAGVRFTPTEFASKKHPGFNFIDSEKTFAPAQKTFRKTRLDPQGQASFEESISANWRPPSALQAVMEATVTEAGGRAVTAYAVRPVDIYPFYIGLKLRGDSGVRRIGEKQYAEIVLLTPDGKETNLSPELEWALSGVSWSSVLRRDTDGRYQFHSERRLTPMLNQTLLSENGAGRFEFTVDHPGPYVLSVRDPTSGVSASVSFYAGSPDQAWLAWSMETPDCVDLQTDKSSYQPGDEAVLLLKAPFTGKGLLTLESDRVLETRVVELTGNTMEIRIPILDLYAPGIRAAFTLLRGITPGEMWTAHRAAGRAVLKVERPELALRIRLSAPASMHPRAPLTADLLVTDSEGKGVEADVFLAAVDEGICMLTAFETPDPLRFFTTPRAATFTLHDIYSQLMPELEREMAGTSSSPGGDAEAALRRRLNPIKAHRFKPVALFAHARTDTNGKGSVTWDVPEFTGSLRLMATMASRSAYAAAHTNIIVKRPLVVRPSLPRFLAPGDSCCLPVAVFNETGADAEVRVTTHGAGPCSISPADGLTAFIKAGGTTNFIFRLNASDSAGKAIITIHAEAGDETYSEDIELPVRPAAPLVFRAGGGIVQPGHSLVVDLPGGWTPGTARYALRGSGLPGIELAGGLESLLKYPYGCLEQTVSAAMPLLYLGDLAAAIRPGQMTPEQIRPFIQSGIERVLSMQNANGLFSYWPGSPGVYEWGSIYATHFLVETARAGYSIPSDRLEASLAGLRKLLDRRVTDPADLNLRPYACLVLALAGQPDIGWMTRLQEQQAELNLTARIELAAALAAANRRRDAVSLLPSLLTTKTPPTRTIGGSLDSTARTTALLLALQLDLDPQSPEIPSLVERLKKTGTGGAWFTTQENAMALMALGKYLRLTKDNRQAFQATLSCEGKTTVFNSREDAQIEMHDRDVNRMVISNAGPGTAYYSWQGEGVPLSGEPEENDRLMSARRRLLNLQGNPVERETFSQGELFVVEWTIEAPADLDNLVIEDLLPAGLEVENAALATSQLVPWAKSKTSLPLRHLDIRDDRVIGFPDRFVGEKRFYYAVRAVTQGRFTYPALAASCMYDPAIRSVHGKGRMEVE